MSAMRCYRCGRFTDDETAYYGFVEFAGGSGDGVDEIFCAKCVEGENK